MVGYSVIDPKHAVIFVMAACLGLAASNADDMSCTSQMQTRGNEMLQTNQLLAYSQSQEPTNSSQVGDEADHDNEEGDTDFPATRGSSPLALMPTTTNTWCNDLRACSQSDLTNGDTDLLESQATFRGSYEVQKLCQRNRLQNSNWGSDAMRAVCRSWKTCMRTKGILDDENVMAFLKAMGVLGTGSHEDALVKRAVPLSSLKCFCLSSLNNAHCAEQVDQPSKITCLRAMMCVDSTVSPSWKEFTCQSTEVQNFIEGLDTSQMLSALEASENVQQHDSDNVRSLLESRAKDRWCPAERFGMKSMG